MPVLVDGLSIINASAAPSMNTAIKGSVVSSHFLRPIVSMLLMAGSPKKKFMAPEMLICAFKAGNKLA